MKRAAIELSMNFLVVILISLVIFGFGVKFVYDIVGGSENLKELTLGDLDKRISQLSCTGTQKVCIEKDTIFLKPDELAVFGVRVLNIDELNTHFFLQLDHGIYITEDKVTLNPGEEGYTYLEILPETRQEVISPNEAQNYGFGIESVKGAGLGTYVFNLYICNYPQEFDSCPHEEALNYDKIQKLYVRIE